MILIPRGTNEELRQVAVRMMRKRPEFVDGVCGTAYFCSFRNAPRKAGFAVENALIGWLRYGSQCVYCGRNLMENWETMMLCETEHLLPRKYKDILWDSYNCALACRVCNCIKIGRDYNAELPVTLRYVIGSGPMTKEQHEALLHTCREKITELRRLRQADMNNNLSVWRHWVEGRSNSASLTDVSKAFPS